VHQQVDRVPTIIILFKYRNKNILGSQKEKYKLQRKMDRDTNDHLTNLCELLNY
jgi:hypothetical protein